MIGLLTSVRIGLLAYLKVPFVRFGSPVDRSLFHFSPLQRCHNTPFPFYLFGLGHIYFLVFVFSHVRLLRFLSVVRLHPSLFFSLFVLSGRQTICIAH